MKVAVPAEMEVERRCCAVCSAPEVRCTDAWRGRAGYVAFRHRCDRCGSSFRTLTPGALFISFPLAAACLGIAAFLQVRTHATGSGVWVKVAVMVALVGGATYYFGRAVRGIRADRSNPIVTR